MRIPSRLRPLIQAAFFAGFVLVFLNFQYPVSMPWSSPFTVADPLAAAGAFLFSRGQWLPALLPVGIFIGATLVLGRAFCGWACPVGFLADIAGFVRGNINRIIKIGKANKAGKDRFGYLQYGVLAAVLLMSIFSLEALSIFDPLVVFQRSSYLLWAGAGIPVVLIGIVAGSLLVERFWCRALCPLGGLLGLAALASPFGRKVSDSCNDCGKCHRTCPMGAIAKDNALGRHRVHEVPEVREGLPEGSHQLRAVGPARAGGFPVETGVPRRRRRARPAGRIGGGRCGHRSPGGIDPAARSPRRREVQLRLRPLRQLR